MKSNKLIAAILIVIVIGIVLYLGYMFSENDGNDNVLDDSGKNVSTFNESDPNGTEEEITLNDADYQAYDNNYGGSPGP